LRLLVRDRQKAGFNEKNIRRKNMANWWVVIYEDERGKLRLNPSPLGTSDTDQVKPGDSVSWANDTNESYTVDSFSAGLQVSPPSLNIAPHSSAQVEVTNAAPGANNYSYACGASSGKAARTALTGDGSTNGVIIVDGPGTGDPKTTQKRIQRSSSGRQEEKDLVEVNGSRR
jgi:hypothetical protein